MVEMMSDLQPERFQKAIQTRDVLMMTPLHRAALFDHVTVVEFLLKHVRLFSFKPSSKIIACANSHLLSFNFLLHNH